jgi:hypothetical protein
MMSGAISPPPVLLLLLLLKLSPVDPRMVSSMDAMARGGGRATARAGCRSSRRQKHLNELMPDKTENELSGVRMVDACHVPRQPIRAAVPFLLRGAERWRSQWGSHWSSELFIDPALQPSQSCQRRVADGSAQWPSSWLGISTAR